MNSRQLPKWFRLLRYWQDERNKTGLSFSLLVGASREPIGEPFGCEAEAIAFSKSLYDEMTSTSFQGRSAVTYPCPGIIRGTGFQLIEGSSDYELKSFEQLWKFYGAAITESKFSVHVGRFYEFDDDVEIKWINEALRA
jgi:hypothetical protein